MRQPETILIVDDEALLRMALRATLEDLGFTVLEASNGQEGLDVCGREHPDLILLDVRMPGLDGFEVCTRLKQARDLREIPVIFLSGMMETDEKVRAFRSGAADYVTKPFRPEEVHARVRTHLELRHQRQRLEERNEDLKSALEEAKILNRLLIDVNERLGRSEALKSRFMSHVRNEINNPLNAIMALGREIEGAEGVQSPVGGLAAMITSEAFTLDFQIRNIICAAELEAGESSLGISHVEIRSILRDVIDSFGPEAQARSVTLVLEMPDREELWFHTDIEKFRLIAANLASNAIKFNREGGTVRLRARLQDGSLLLEVEDTGPGIRTEDQPLIFEPFKQLENGPSRGHPGQGLGLSVAKALMDLLGGRLSLTSVLGSGTTFSGQFPNQYLSAESNVEAFDGNLFFFEEHGESD